MSKKVIIEMSEQDAIRLYGLLDGCEGSGPDAGGMRVFRRMKKKVIMALQYVPGIVAHIDEKIDLKEHRPNKH